MNILNDSIYSLIKKLALPASVGLIFSTLYNVVDTFFAGRYLSSEALAGLTYIFPIFLIAMAVGSGMSNGLIALMSESLGMKKKKRAYKLALQGFYLNIILAILLFVFLWFVTPLMMDFVGAGAKSAQEGIAYMRTYIFGLLFSLGAFVFNGILTVQGDTKSFRNSLIYAFGMNVILDPLFILYFDFGVYGLAFATLLVQTMSCIYLGYKAYRSDLIQTFLGQVYPMNLGYIWEILKQGIPATVNIVTMSSQIFIMNKYVRDFGGDYAVAGMGAGFRVEQIVIVPTFALSIAAMTIIGQNYGANQFNRIKETYRKSNIIGFIIVLIGGLASALLGKYFIQFFDPTPEVVEFGATYLILSACIMPSYVVTNVATASLQALQYPNVPLVISVFRRLVLLWAAMEFFAVYLDLGMKGVLISIALLPWIGVVIFHLAAVFVMKRVASKPPKHAH
ncbi:MAG: MATE family efflux transporter [Flavobacteriaceae bacterium]